MPNQAVAQSTGHAYRLKVQLLKQEFNRAGALQHILLRYTLALLSQMARTAVCSRHHSVQLCRWLLLRLDRSALERPEYDTGVDRQHAEGAARGVQ